MALVCTMPNVQVIRTIIQTGAAHCRYWAPNPTKGLATNVHKEVYRMVETAHTFWGGDLMMEGFLRWGNTKVKQITVPDFVVPELRRESLA
eukprot:SAG11_NODE_24689_length_369_cov_1.529630_1_plen_90_part_01